MKYINFANKLSDIKAVFLVHKNEFSKPNIVLNLLSLLDVKYHENVAVIRSESNETNEDIERQLSKLPAGTLICVHDGNLYKRLTHERLLPKTVGVVTPALGNKHVQYFNFSSKALYLHANLITNRTCMEHVNYFLNQGNYLVTQVERKLLTPKTEEEVKKAFKYLMTKPELGVDIETTSLKFYEAELVSISFAIDEQCGYTFHVKNVDFIKWMVLFFQVYQGRLVWHNGSYDLKVLAYRYFDSDSRELYRTYEDTLFLHYICTNSPERFPRDLGTLTAALCGDYKLTKAELQDMMNVDVDKVCEYNLDDARGTLWIYHKYRNRIHSEYLYDKFKKWQWYLTQTELAGIPFSAARRDEVEKELNETIRKDTKRLMAHPDVLKTMEILRQAEMDKYNSTHVKQKEIFDFQLNFNANSGDHMRVLLFEVMGLTPDRKTPSGKIAVDAKVMKKLKPQATEAQQEVFDMLDSIAKASKMVGTFIKALHTSSREVDGHHYLHGSFNLAKVVSGRLSSSDPNLMNMPSGTTLAKMFKSAIIARPNWLFGGADFSSLEERVNTILTKDPNKEAVYFDGYDGHSFRALYYFPEALAEIKTNVERAETSKDEETLYEVKVGDHIYCGKAGDFLVDSTGQRRPIEDFLCNTK